MTVVINARDVVVSESDGFADVVVSLSAPNMLNDVTVEYALLDHTAFSSLDFGRASGPFRLTFAPGVTSQVVRVPITDDTTQEGTESLFFVLSSPSTNAQVGKSTSVITIVDNDAPTGTPSISVRDAVVDEMGQVAQFVVTLDKPSTVAVGVSYSTAGGTASSGTDFTATSGSLRFAPGETSKMVLVPIINDTIAEVDELFTLVLSNPSNGTLAQATGTARITANDAPAVPSPVISVDDVVVSESDGFADVVVRLSAPSTLLVSVDYSTSQSTAVSPSDFGSVSGTLTFAPGVTSQVVRVPITDDTTQEGTESLFFVLSSPSTNAQVGKSTSVITIVDNDAPTGTPSISVRDAVVGETGQVAQFVVTLDKPSTVAVGVSYSTAGGTASSGTDFTATSGSLSFTPGQTSKTVFVPINNDTIAEVDELFTLVLSNPSNSTLAQATGTARITANDAPAVPSPVISADDVVVSEPDGFADVVVRLSAPSTLLVSVDYSTSQSTAVSPSDFGNVSGRLTFAPGVTSQVVRVPITDDTTAESIKSLFFVLSSPSTNAQVGKSTSVITIVDNDAPTGTPSISVRDAVVGETGQVAQFVVTLDKPSTATVGVSYSTAGGTASSGTDFTATSGSLRFAPGETSKTVLVPINNDTIAEPDELFTLELSSPSTGTLAKATGTARITASDAPAVPSPVISVGDVVVSESDGYADVVVNLSAPSTLPLPVTVTYNTLAGTADLGDFVSVSGTLTFAPGVTSQVVRVPITADMSVEVTESFFFALGTLGTTAFLGNTRATITILDGNGNPTPPPPTYTVAPSGASVNEGSSVTYTVNTTGLTNGTVLRYELMGVSASDVVDGNITGNITIDTAGRGSVTISLTADGLTEGNVTLRLNLLNGSSTVGTAAPVTVVDTSIANLSSNDLIRSGLGNEFIDGGAGIDTVIYGGIKGNYVLARTGTDFSVTASVGTEGIDRLTNVERLKFSDSSVALDIPGNAGTTAKILGAVFGKDSVTNKAYVGIGLQRLDGGMSYLDLMQLAINAQLGANPSNAAVVNLLYTNVVGTPPSAGDRDFYVGLLTSGVHTVASLGKLAADTGLNTANINLVGLATSGLEYLPQS